MNFSQTFILRPVATTLLMVAIFLCGVVAYGLLPTSALPSVEYPIIKVSSKYPGANPQAMLTLVTAPLENQLGKISGLYQMSSTSSMGMSSITLQFQLNKDIAVAEQEVQAAINAVSTLLPSDIPVPPVYHKVNPADAPVLSLAITSKQGSLLGVQDIVDSQIVPKISQIMGVGLVTVGGAQKTAIRIYANPSALASYNLNLEDIRKIIAGMNANQPKGTIDGERQSLSIAANDQLQSTEEYKNLIIGYHEHSPIRLEAVASVRSGSEDEGLAAWSGAVPAIIIDIQKQPGANAIKVADYVKELLPKLNQGLPKHMHMQILMDRTTNIKASLESVQHDLLFAIALVIMVIFLFLRSVATTIIPGIAVPLSLVGTLAVMYALGFSLNNLTFMALTIATGFLVDDAIVMIENIARHREEGASPMQAAIKGAKQIGFTIISLTISLLAVLIPLFFMGDVIGRLFHEFAVTLAVAIIFSAFISLTLTPMMCARSFRTSKTAVDDNHATSALSRVIHVYSLCLKWALRHKFLIFITWVVSIGVTVAIIVFIPKGFLPSQDSGLIQITTEANAGVSFQKMSALQMSIVEKLRTHDAVNSISSFVGIDESRPTLNSGRIIVSLKDVSQRQHITDIINEFKETTATVKDIRLFMQAVQDMTIDFKSAQLPYQLTITTGDYNSLLSLVPKYIQKIKEIPGIEAVASDLYADAPSLYVNVNRDRAASLAINISDIETTLYNSYGGRIISNIFTQSNQYRVLLQLDKAFQDEPTDLERLYITSKNGVQVPLSAVATLEKSKEILSLNRLKQRPTATLSFSLAPNKSLGDVLDAIKERLPEKQVNQEASIKFQGAANAMDASQMNLLLLFLASVTTMYIVLGILYESYIHPLTIISTLPSATVGALAALLVLKIDLNVIGVIGIILLVGIVKKNAIMMIDFALEAQRTQNMTPDDAIYNACLVRFRPILMTTMTALFGALPLLLAFGAGAEFRKPLGVVIVGGLIFSQLMTLFTTPVIYLILEQCRVKVSAIFSLRQRVAK